MNNSLIINGLNKVLSFFQNKFSYLWENSLFLQNIDNLIFATIIGVFILSTFASSDTIGYLALTTFFLTIFKIFTKKEEKLEPNIFELFLIMYFLIVIISLAGSSLFHLSLKGFFKTFIYLGFYFSAAQYYKNNLSRIPFTIATIALCASSQGFIGFYQNFNQVGEISTWQDVSNINPEDVMTRVYGTLSPYNPNLLGGYLLTTLPCLFGSFILGLINKQKVLASISILLAILTSVTLVLTGCRGAYIGFAIMIFCFFAFLAKFIWIDLEKNKEFFKKVYLSVLGGLVAFVTSIVLLVSSIRTRVFSIFAMRSDSSTSFRLNVYQSAIQMIKDNWLVGIGIGNQNFREIYGLYMRTGFDALSAYCIFLEIALESGVFALIAFVGFIFTLLHKSFKFILQSNDIQLSLIIAIASISVIATIVHGLVDTVFFRPQLQFIFWTMVAFVSAVLSSDKRMIN